ncbi:MAG TPA: FecR family protein, partial [Bryobacteraceae bacterium]|nr:FecR family protein [Bryobacteraceae bacterium]
MKLTLCRPGIAILLVAGAIATARAQDDSAGHGVARISIISGDVSVQRGDSGERSAAAVNAPVAVGDIVATAPGARTEVQFDSANMVRLSSDSEIRLSDLNRGRFQFQVGRGTVIFSVVRDSHAQVEISTPSVSVRPLQRGAYRVSVFDDGHSEITVRVGEAEIYTPRGTEKLRPGQTMTVRGDPSDPEFQTGNAIQQDDFDHWNAQRDQSLSRSTSYQHVSPDIDGAQDLDANGRWVNTPDYGTVWSPTVDPDWAPYRNGRWVWEDWYGWTWVSYDPWGWAPYHYGRWFWGAGYGWCWWPGPVYARHYWSPALVAFFGFGGFHVGVGFGGAGFGWVPLAPYEVFHPWWGRGFYGGYRNHNVLVNNINIVNNTNITRMYRNARLGNGATAVNSADFARGRFSSPMRLTGEQLRSASLVRGQVPIAPTASSLRFSDRAVASPSRNASFNGRFFSHNQPAAVNRVPFTQQQQSLSQVNRSAVPRAEAPAAANSGGWRRYESPQA